MFFVILCSMIVSLLLTLLLEDLFALLWGIRNTQDLILVLLVNILTNPVVVFCYHATHFYAPNKLTAAVALLELAAVCIEWLLYRWSAHSIRHPFAFSLFANLFSFCMGFGISLLCHH